MAKTPISQAILVFFNQYRQIAFYNTYSNAVEAGFALLQSNGDKKYVELKVSGQDLFMTCSADAPDPSEFASKTYSFNDNAGMLWFDGNGESSVIVGTGDVRDGITNARIDAYSVPTDSETRLIIECKQPFQLKVHYLNITVRSTTVPVSTLQSCQS